MISIKDTVESGQIFRYEKLDENRYLVRHTNRVAILSQNSDGVLSIESEDKKYWERFLDLENEFKYQNIVDNCISYGGVVAEAAKRYGGIHILRQDPWETLISFIVSQNNNIPKIRSTISKLCLACGDLSSFPHASSIIAADESGLLDNISLGYRKNYIVLASKSHLSGYLNVYDLRSAYTGNYEAHMYYLKHRLTGVGDKVASYVCLFGLQDYCAVPRDIWINRFYSEYPNIDLNRDFGDNAGIVQQYLYHYMRKEGKK